MSDAGSRAEPIGPDRKAVGVGVGDGSHACRDLMARFGWRARAAHRRGCRRSALAPLLRFYRGRVRAGPVRGFHRSRSRARRRWSVGWTNP